VLARATDLDEFFAHDREFPDKIKRQLYPKKRRKQKRIEKGSFLKITAISFS
jgi:hypothetical protein